MKSKNYIEKIKEIIAKNNWTQVQFADEIGVTFATVNRWLKQHTKPHPSQIRAIDKLYKEEIGVIPLSKTEIQVSLKKADKAKRKFSNIYDIFQNKPVNDEFLLELTYNSDAIEGSTLTKKETEAILFDKAIIKDKSLIEHMEAVNHSEILIDVFVGNYRKKITENLICEIHRNLMKGIRTDAGQYSKYQRGIRGVDIILPHPEDVPEEMGLLCKKINNIKGHPMEHIAKMHADFELIHPFGDGNGRVGRIMMIIQLLNNNYAPCIIGVKEKAEYYEYLEYAQRKSETHFVQYLAKAVLAGYEIIEKRQSQR
jgi:Fic family protein